MSVLVYVVDPDSNIPPVAKLFKNKMFRFHTFNAQDAVTESRDLSKQAATELNTYTTILQDAKRNLPSAHVIILDNRMTTTMDDRKLASLISKLTSKNVDVFYLSKYLDRCDLYDNHENLEDFNVTISQTYQPNGIQALMLSPRGRDVLLGAESRLNRTITPITQPLNVAIRQAVTQGDLVAFTTTPQVFHFDIQKLKSQDMNLLNQCIGAGNIKNNSGSLFSSGDSGASSMSIFWFILVIIIVVLLVFLGLWLAKK